MVVCASSHSSRDYWVITLRRTQICAVVHQMRVAKPRVKTCRWCSFSPSTQDSQSYADHGCIDNPFNNNIQFHDVNRGLLDLLTVISWYKMHFLLIYQRVRMRMESLEKVSYVELVGLMNKSRHPSWLSRVLMTAP